jgi:hypothetical protein
VEYGIRKFYNRENEGGNYVTEQRKRRRTNIRRKRR